MNKKILSSLLSILFAATAALAGPQMIVFDNNNVLFLSKAAGEKDNSIYRMSVDGKTLKRLIKNGRFPSVSTP